MTSKAILHYKIIEKPGSPREIMILPFTTPLEIDISRGTGGKK